MAREVAIEELQSIGEHIEQLADMLIQVVDDGASIGFLLPLDRSDAMNYWQHVLQPNVILYVANVNDEVAGTVQLHLCTKQNSLHRAEIAKLMTHPRHRRKGIARLLMQRAEERAKREGRSLLVLDTREEDPSNLLYASLGFVQAGRIPHYARSVNGELDATILYYKWIG